MLNRLDRYILSEAVGPFLFGLAAFTSLLFVNLLFSAIDFINNGLAPSIVLKWMGLHVPEIVVMTLPMATLLGTLLTFGRLSSASEITAMKAAGRPIYRIMVPIVIASLFVSLGALYVSDRVVAPARLRAEEVITGQKQDPLQYIERDNFYYPVYENGKAKSIWMASHFNGRIGKLSNVYLFEFGDMGLSRIVFSNEAFWQKNVWIFGKGYIQQLGVENSYQLAFTDYKVFNTPAPKEMAAPDNPDPNRMTLKQIKEHIAILKKRGSDVKVLTVEYHLKMSIPLASLVFAIVAVPFGLQPNRGGSSVGLGLSIVLIFSFYVMLMIAKSLGQSGIIAPTLAAWIPDIFFGALGIYFVYKKTK